MTAPEPDAATRKRLRRIAHQLIPVVRIGDKGISDSVIYETDRALTDHELIKVRVAMEDRKERKALTRSLAGACDAALVQEIGKVAVLFRENPDAEARLSNLAKYR